MSAAERSYRLAFDATLGRPGCVLLQAALRCDMGIVYRFPTATWLTSLTPNLRVYRVTEAELALVIEKVKKSTTEGTRHG